MHIALDIFLFINYFFSELIHCCYVVINRSTEHLMFFIQKTVDFSSRLHEHSSL